MKPASLRRVASAPASLAALAPQPCPPKPPLAPVARQDPNLWLEDIHGDAALAWVRARNEETWSSVQGPAFAALCERLRAVLDTKQNVCDAYKYGDHWYALHQDAEHPRGLWRRTTHDEFAKSEPCWETLLDLDALNKAENKSWVIYPGAEAFLGAGRFLINLSPSGSDLREWREFDAESKSFVEGGFFIHEGKSFYVSCIDADTLYVPVDAGEDSLTSAGFPRVVRRWSRGTALQNAPLVFEVDVSDVYVYAWHDGTPGFERDFVQRVGSRSSDTFLLDGAGPARKIDVPGDAEIEVHREWLLLTLSSPWTVGDKTYGAGELIVTKFEDFLGGKRNFVSLFAPTDTTVLAPHSHTWTRDHLLLTELCDVKCRVSVLTPRADGPWEKRPLSNAPDAINLQVSAAGGNDFRLVAEDFLTPRSEFLGTGGVVGNKVKSDPAFFDAAKSNVTQHFTTSKDGTRIPYFLVAPHDLPLDGTTPTLMTAYGGFNSVNLPTYSGTLGRAWLEKGRTLVLANIRGGSEYGPRWHRAGQRENHAHCHEDLAAVAQDLIKRKITSAKHLGIQGQSNGGLLMGNMLTQYPSLFGAVVPKVPLMDMKRYTHLLGGSGWLVEYGDPDNPEEWAFIKNFAPYQNVRPGVTYPPTLFVTCTTDTRVSPGHARKMMEKMRTMGCDVHFYEWPEGGHGGAVDNAQAAAMDALNFTFLQRNLR